MALGIVLAALIAATVKVAVRRPRAAVATYIDESESAAATPEHAPSPARLSAPTRRETWPAAARIAAAQISGQVLPPADTEVSFGELSVAADDGTRTIEARVFPDGRFTIHLPAGQYAVTAALGKWMGIAPSVAARPDASREVTIQLAMSAAISGHVRGPGGVGLTVRASPAGRNDWQDQIAGTEGDFLVENLIPGRAYDLVFEGTAVRTTTLRSVTAPAEDVAAVVIALPVLRGAVGFPSGEHCPITRVALYGPNAVPSSDADVDDDDEGARLNQVGNVDNACRFELPVPDGPTGMVLVAAGDGWRIEEQVSIPPLGDPEPICLNPPCRADPLDGLARVRLSLDDAPRGGIHGSITPVKGEGLNVFGCGSSGRSCQIEALDPGEAVVVKVGSADCASRTQTLVLAAGDNAVIVPCVPTSILKITADDKATETEAVIEDEFSVQ